MLSPDINEKGNAWQVDGINF